MWQLVWNGPNFESALEPSRPLVHVSGQIAIGNALAERADFLRKLGEDGQGCDSPVFPGA